MFAEDVSLGSFSVPCLDLGSLSLDSKCSTALALVVAIRCVHFCFIWNCNSNRYFLVASRPSHRVGYSLPHLPLLQRSAAASQKPAHTQALEFGRYFLVYPNFLFFFMGGWDMDALLIKITVDCIPCAYLIHRVVRRSTNPCQISRRKYLMTTSC